MWQAARGAARGLPLSSNQAGVLPAASPACIFPLSYSIPLFFKSLQLPPAISHFFPAVAIIWYFFPCVSARSEMDRDEEGVDDSELCVKLSKDGRLVYHVREIPDPQAELHQLQVEEIWQQDDANGSYLLGRGGFGSVYKETCIRDIRGAKLGRFRAVKVIERGDQVTKLYYREELKALAKFSAPRVSSG